MPRPRLQRTLALVMLFASTAFLGAVPKAAPPTPSPAPSRQALFAPAVIVYPFDVGGELKADAGRAIAQLFNEQLAAAGGVTVLPSPVNIKRVDFATTARALKADYYISGYLTPVGDGAALVMQVVSASSGIMILSHTSQIYSSNDASAQAFMARQAVLAHSGAGQAQYDQSAQSTPQPSATDGASVSLSGLGGLLGIFHRGPKTSAAQTKSVAEADKPSRIAIVAHLDGTADSATLAASPAMLRTALDRYFKTQTTALAIDPAKSASTICGSNRNATIAAGTLSQKHIGGFHGHTETSFALKVYTCFGAVIYSGDAVAAESAQAAIDAAVGVYAKAHPDNA